MKKILIGVLAGMLAFAPVALADDDDEDFERYFRELDRKLDMVIEGYCPPVPPVIPCPEPQEHECLVEFIDDINQLPTTAALTVYRVYADTNGKKFLIPTWAITPTPQPPEDPDEPPVPEWKPTADNAVDKCASCHKGDDESKFKYANWRDSRHDDHKKFSCTSCHSK